MNCIKFICVFMLVTIPDEFAITILKPSHQSVWSQWILGKQNPDLTPPNLRERSWHDFPRVEVPAHIKNLYTGKTTHSGPITDTFSDTFVLFPSNLEEDPRSSIWH